MSSNQYIGKRMNWTEMNENFPQMWVCVSDYQDIESGNFNGVIESICRTVQEKDTESERLFNEKKKVCWNFIGDAVEGVELWGL